MSKFKRNGFAPLETLLVLVIIAIIAFTAWFVFHTKSNTDSTYGTAANTQANSAPAAKKTNTKTPAPAPAASQVVQTKTDSKLGKYLADGSGKTLYTYDKDTANTSTCTGDCLTTWPTYKATSSSASLPANVGTLTRSDGTVQYTYKKMPLYYFTGDSSAGQVTGDGVDGFSVAKP